MNKSNSEKPVESPDRHVAVEEEGPRGVVRVHDDVFVSVASICACQVPGVARVGEAPASQINFKKLVGLGDTKHGVRLKRTNGQVKEMEVFISVREGYSLPAVAEAVQRAIKEGVEKMTGTEIQRVNIYVESIEFPSSSSEPMAISGPEPREGS